MAKWFVATKRANFDEIADCFSISPVLARIIRNRDVMEENDIRKFLHGTLEDMHDPFLLKDMKKGVAILQNKITEQKQIRVIGDYDIDGVCSSYILKKGLEACHAIVDVVIPHRIKDGYGLNEDLIREAKADGIDTIITCDNGISALNQIALAKELGITIIVTDHHEVPYEEQEDGSRVFLIPKADAVIDPKQEECNYPFKGICGAMVAYKVIQALLKVREDNSDVMVELLELAAFATIGDVMELKDENRIVVKEGLKSMTNSRNLGLAALIEVSGIQDKVLSPYHVGFVLGPCLNASGRLDTAKRALELLDAKERKEAITIATDLKALNDSRKELTLKGVQEAITQIESASWKEDTIYIVYLPDCHESLAGIIAGRIREKYGKPTFVLTRSEEGVKGSGRSIEAYHMYEEMTKHKEFFVKYGGHKLAAGLSMEEKDIETLRKVLNEDCRLTQEDLEEKLLIDVPMPISYVTDEFVEELDILEPFGVGNPKPVFAQKNVSIQSYQIIGKNKNVMKFFIEDDNHRTVPMVYFGNIEKMQNFLSDFGNEPIFLSICYYPTFNEFRGKKSLQLVLQDYQEVIREG